MKIRTIEYENFRNFRDHGEIQCSTDGKVTIIYGKNGDGKTTLHQLLQWIFYGQVKFNKTTTNHLYNLAFERKQEYGIVFEVFGRIDFEHEGILYSMTRKNIYKKGLEDSEKIGEEVSLQKRDEDYNWKRVDRPEETIEKMLPSGLAEYFFFDGESMIADLRVKGKDSASKLRKALYSMFDLDVLEMALSHIGRTELKTTVLGKIYLDKAPIAIGSNLSSVKATIGKAQNEIALFEKNIDECEKEKLEKQELIRRISEQIGSTKSKAEYEEQRNYLKNQRDSFLYNAKTEQSRFGDEVMDMFPSLLISKAVADAKGKLNLKATSSNIPTGLNKRLITYLTKVSTKQCVCGHELGEEERKHISEFLKQLPPHSYTSLYHDFITRASLAGKGYDKARIENIILNVINNMEHASQCDAKIRDLDEAEKDSQDIEDLIVTRGCAEDRISELDKEIVEFEKENKVYNTVLKSKMKQFDELTAKTAANELATQKLEIMSEVKKYFETKLEKASEDYSQRLEQNIQTLLDEMLTSKRKVIVSKEFTVRVTDSFNDESKSEGQFAVVSFAYIGGILRMLKEEERLEGKEYPLVLDGPFSKLDPDQRQNVVDMLPKFAPQVIVFSKDDLHDVFSKDTIGKVWTIQSNEEKNVARIEEGKLWK